MSTKLEPPTFWFRQVAAFPLNGEGGYEIHLLETDWPRFMPDDTKRFYVVDLHQDGDPRAFATFGEAIARCLNNAGWGTYKIEDVT